MKTRWKVSFLLIVIILSYRTCWNYKNKVYDWDMPGYLGCLFTPRFPNDSDKVRVLTYESIKKEAPIDQYNNVIGAAPVHKVRQSFAENTQSFTEQLPYFQIKMGYNFMVSLLYELGISAPMSILLLSLISFFISGVLVFYILKIIFPENYYMAIGGTTVLAFLPPLTYMSRISTPDLFILQFLLIFIIGLIQSWSKWIIYLILLIITFIRPDYITFTLSYLMVFVIFDYYTHKKIDLTAFAVGALLLLSYLYIIKLYHYPGWKEVFFDSFISRRPIISAQPAVVGLEDYFKVLYNAIISFKTVIFISLSILMATFYISKNRWIRTYAVFFFSNIYIKFVFFPHSSGLRFFLGFIFLLFIMFLYALSKKYNGFQLRKIA